MPDQHVYKKGAQFKQPDWSALARKFDSGGCTPEDFARVLDLLEILPYRDINAAIVPVQQALSAAARIGREDLIQRTRLIHADVLGRQAQIAESGRMIREINAWAAENDEAHVLARSHRLLGSFFRRLGDDDSSLEHSLRGLKHLPSGVAPATRADHLMMLALALDEAGSYEDAKQRFDEVLEIANATGDVQFELFALNNMAFTYYDLGDLEKAAELIAQIRQLSEKHGFPLIAMQLDTIAKGEILLGHPEEAERTLLPVITEPSERRLSELASLPECMLTVAQAQLMQGKLDEAQAMLDEARHLCDDHGLSRLSVQVRLRQSELHAAAGRYKEAYEEHLLYHAEAEALRSAEREAKARIFQAVFEAEEARKSSEHFREMALRDPLTGLRNRRFIDGYLDDLLTESQVNGEPLTLAIIDLDSFKRINDTLSHVVGDTVLINIAKILSVAAAEPAVVARMGGEEFIAVFPRTDEKQGRELAERMCRAIRSADWSPITGALPVTASIGVHTVHGAPISRTELLAVADRRLYVAKRSGKDRVVADDVCEPHEKF
ncbi:tetratricopeptide repeat-containing diguanylate cyclase [Saccharibacillus alkalitolerans]|uniref:GGDEF domain-containing protein n=1 Tax=Saccharibacillus alkalitolerans TaxID=2705290 RepID=A0ABX0F9V4_9BACL|nr:diguanylate cyclase [Saccharibacillus alkalitolerans]NGZ77721.1 GGDEF domain-containing protein [Saccharibacillus alkalitolerans]